MSEPVSKSAEAAEVSRADMFKPIGATAQGVNTSATTPTAAAAAAPASPAVSGAAEAEPEEDDGMLAEDEEDDGPRSELLDGISTLPSLCVACEENGKTNIFPTVIPFFRDVILMSFRCQHCGHRSSEVQEMEIQEKGSRFTLQVKSAQDLNRQLIKSNNGIFHVPHLNFEIPRHTQQGVFTTLEGMLYKAEEDLSATLPLYQAQAPEQAPALEAFCEKLRGLRDEANMPYEVVLDDPAGNSFLENPLAPHNDPGLSAVYYTRNVQQNHSLGLYAENAGDGVSAENAASAGVGDLDDPGEGAAASGGAAQTEWRIHPGALQGSQAVTSEQYTSSDPKLRKHGALIREATGGAAATVQHRTGGAGQSAPMGSGLLFDSSRADNLKEVMTFPVDCFACGARGESRMCVTDVPHFREIILMAFSCEKCGFRDVEVKAGGAVPEHGTVITLKLDGGDSMAVDLRRDVIKSDSASIEIPELEFEIEHGSLGGMYTTVEGLLGCVEDRLKASNRFSLESGDSARGAVVAGSAAASDAADAAAKAKAAGVAAAAEAKKDSDAFAAWWERFQACKSGETPFTLIVRDPMSSSYIWSPWEDEETGDKSADPRMTIERYERTHQEQLDMGLVDMKTENYGELPAVEEDEEEAPEAAQE